MKSIHGLVKLHGNRIFLHLILREVCLLSFMGSIQDEIFMVKISFLDSSCIVLNKEEDAWQHS